MEKKNQTIGVKRNREIKNLYLARKRKKTASKFPFLRNREKYENKHEDFKEIKFTDESEFLTNNKFSDLKLDKALNKSLLENGYENLSEVQSKTLPKSLSGKDLFVEAPTGSGKTLSFLLPIIDRIMKEDFRPEHGVCGLIIVPIRELGIQILNEAKRIVGGMVHPITGEKAPTIPIELVIGGGNKRKEADNLKKGANILIGTPGRLLDHLLNTEFNYRNLSVLCLDEADKILEHGFEMDLKSILYKIKKFRSHGSSSKLPLQCLLFSATNNPTVKEYAKKFLSIESFEYVAINPSKKLSIVKNLTQGYVTIDTAKKFMLLLTFIRKNRNKKIIVFFATCASVNYFSKLLNLLKIKCYKIHGELSQKKRSKVFNTFRESKGGILFSTNVCARGIDISNVSWIVQYDPPNDLKDYVHRVGRTARAGRSGKAVLFLTKNEEPLLEEFKKLEIKLVKFKVDKILDIQAHVEDLVDKNFSLLESAYKTFQTKCYSYKSYPFKEIFVIKKMDLEGLATQFGLKKVPYISWEEFQ